MITYQNPLTIITPVDPDKLEELRNILNSIQQPDIEANPLVPFVKIKSVHFARFVIIECDTDRYPVQLAFSANFDGDEKSFLVELIREAKDGLEQIYNCCIGFTGNLLSYWAAHKVPVRAFYNGHQGISVEQIKQEEDLRSTIADYLDQTYRNGAIHNRSAKEIKQKVASFIKESGNYDWAVKDKGLSSFQLKVFRRQALLSGIAGAVMVLLLVGLSVAQVCKLLKIPVTVGYLVLAASLGAGFMAAKNKLNQLENTDPIEPATPTLRHVKDLMFAENFQVQNQLTHLVEIKPGRFRLGLLKFVLGSINFLARTYFNKGELGSIPSIHFARWVITDQNKRLLFFSNFDGSWENYLGDFVDKASVGLTAVWSNTKNFPRSKNLIQEGAQDEQQFKEWARHLQIATQVWYSAYKELSVQNINNNALIRSGLFREMDEANAQAWLDRIYCHKS